MISRTIIKANYFAKHVQMTFNKEKKMGSILGGICSIFIYLLTLSFIFNMGLEIFKKQKPRATLVKKFLPIASKVDLKNEKFIFSVFFLSAAQQMIIDPSIYNIQFTRRINQRGNLTVQNILTKKCFEYRTFFSELGFLADFDGNKLNNTDCFGMEQDDVILGGNFGQEYFSQIQIILSKCKNGTSPGIVCRPPEEIDKIINGGFLQMYYIDKYVDVNNLTHPFVNFFFNYFNILDSKMQKRTSFFLQKTDVYTDEGFLLENINNETKYTFDRSEERVLTANDEKIIVFNLAISNNNMVYIRNYMKLQDLAAMIGGILKFLLLVGDLLNYKFSEYKMYEHMVNSLFNVKSSVEGIKNPIINVSNIFIINKSSQCQMNSNIHLQNNLFSIMNKQKAKNDVKIQVDFSRMNNKSKEFKFNMRFIFKFLKCCCKKKKEWQLIETVLKKIHKYLDYMQLIKSIQKFQKLQNIIFTKNQKKLFKYDCKKVIDPENKNALKLKQNILSKEYYNDLFKSYIKTKFKPAESKTNKRLIKSLDSDIKTMFDKVIQTNMSNY